MKDKNNVGDILQPSLEQNMRGSEDRVPISLSQTKQTRFIIKIFIVWLLVESLMSKHVLLNMKEHARGERERDRQTESSLCVKDDRTLSTAADPHCTRFVLLTIK